MEIYPIILESILYGAAIVLFLKKRELVVLYIPLLFFIHGLIEVAFVRSLIWYFLITCFFSFAAFRVNFLKRINGPAVLLISYFVVLYIFSHDLSDTRPALFAMACLIGTIFVAPNLYLMHGKEIIWEDLYKMSSWVLYFFIANTLLSTATGYVPNPLYGRTTGVIYGNMGATSFMIIPVALFIYLTYDLKKAPLLHIAIGLLAFALATLSFRRTAVVTSALALICFLLIVFMEEDRRRAVALGIALVGMAALGLFFTDFQTQFEERYQGRFSDKEVIQADEGRMVDHVMVYEDMVVHGRYSILFGYGFFNSAGNYGGGVHRGRSLHPDLPVIAHASGVIGLALYLGMVFKVFRQSWQRRSQTRDKILWFFCLLVFLVFTISGRITDTAYAVAFFLLLYVPVAPVESREEPEVSERMAEVLA